MLHKNIRKPELKKVKKKLALNQAAKPFFVAPAIASMAACASKSCFGSNLSSKIELH